MSLFIPSPLASLPSDIIVNYLLPWLDPGDIINFSKCVHFAINKKVYHLTFPESPPLKHYTRREFLDRSKAKLYFIGGCDENVDWTHKPLPPNRERIEVDSVPYLRMHSPLRVESRGHVIIQINSSRLNELSSSCIDILDSNGKVYTLPDINSWWEQLQFVRTSTRRNRIDNFMRGRFETTTREKGARAIMIANRAMYIAHRMSSKDPISSFKARAFAVRARRQAIIANKPPNIMDTSPANTPEFRAIMKALGAENPVEVDHSAEDDERALNHPSPHEFDNISSNYVFTDSFDIHYVSESYFSLPRCEPRFHDLASKRCKCALDQYGILWVWGYLSKSPQQGVPTLLQDAKTGELITGKILKVREGGWHPSCLIEGRGIILISNEASGAFYSNGWRAGYPCFDDHLCTLATRTIPRTATGIKDYYVLNSITVILHTNGTLSCVNPRLGYDKPQPIKSRDRFIDIKACENYVIGLTSDGRVSTGKAVWSTLVMNPVDELEGTKITSISAGSYHFLALSSEGDVYAWGRESGCCGCLGIGRFADIKKVDGLSFDKFGLSLKTPTKINLPGKVYDIAAGSDISMFLIYDK